MVLGYFADTVPAGMEYRSGKSPKPEVAAEEDVGFNDDWAVDEQGLPIDYEEDECNDGADMRMQSSIIMSRQDWFNTGFRGIWVKDRFSMGLLGTWTNSR